MCQMCQSVWTLRSLSSGANFLVINTRASSFLKDLHSTA